jgi:2-polyprenyl-6-methoxyphenol hydroxylase-like FAD-dependent oxidoreductase
MSTDVLIVGAGPSGLTLANVLARYGVDFRIVDKKSGPVEQSRAAIVHVRTLELWEKLGLAEKALRLGLKTTRVEVYERRRRATEFSLAGKGAEGFTPFPYALSLPQGEIERLLVEGLENWDAWVEWNMELLELSPTEDRVRALLKREDGAEEPIDARWVVGADGASSQVRHSLGLGFGGETYEQTGLLADVEMNARLASGKLRLNLTRGGFVGIGALPGGLYRLFGAVPPDFAARDQSGRISHEAYGEVSLEDLQKWFDEYFFVDARLERVEWASLFRIHSRITERFRVGNVFLVGDASHIHSPAGGQGMNLGVGDAFNLGWKLALVAKGQAYPELLDSYEAERYPVAKTVLRYSDRGFGLEATKNPIAVWARANVATRLVGPLTRLGAVRHLIFRLFSQTWISYRGSPALTGALPKDKGPRPGDRAPYGVFESEQEGKRASIFELLQGTEHHPLLFEGLDPDPALYAYRLAVEEVLGRYEVDTTVHLLSTTEAGLLELYGAHLSRLFLVRPDGHVSFVGGLGNLGDLVTYLDGLFPMRDDTREQGPRG